MISKDFRKIIIDKLTGILKPRHFKKTGNTFSHSNGDLTYFINIQSSQTSTSTTLKVTVNIEIYSSLVYQLQDTSLPEKWSRHYTRRIGNFLDNQPDKWWTVSNEKEAQQAGDEIVNLTVAKILPTLETLKTTNDLANLWRQNKSPGLTEYQRKEYLKLLDTVK